jgi:RimJ/RimL family protein N-acetyltransferase
VETARLILRPFTRADLDALSAIYADAEVMATIRNGVRDRGQTEANLGEYAADWADHGWGVWAITSRADGALLGMCGYVRHAELGYILARAARGQGFATEAARACLRFGFERLFDFDVISAGALRENHASRRVLEKLGMRRSPNAYFDTQGGVYYAIARADWRPTNDAYLIGTD